MGESVGPLLACGTLAARVLTTLGILRKPFLLFGRTASPVIIIAGGFGKHRTRIGAAKRSGRGLRRLWPPSYGARWSGRVSHLPILRGAASLERTSLRPELAWQTRLESIEEVTETSLGHDAVDMAEGPALLSALLRDVACHNDNLNSDADYDGNTNSNLVSDRRAWRTDDGAGT